MLESEGHDPIVGEREGGNQERIRKRLEIGFYGGKRRETEIFGTPLADQGMMRDGCDDSFV